MKNRDNRDRIFAWAAVVCLAGVLYLLAVVEQSVPGSTIKNPWDAFWYFLETITTVGYGDVHPVTPFGRFLGIIFIILSCGLISLLVSATISFMNGSFILRLRIRSARVSSWCIFDRDTPESRYLAERLDQAGERTGIIFCRKERQITGFLTFRYIFTPLSVQETAFVCGRAQKDSIIRPPRVFLLSEDEDQNLETALEILSFGRKPEIYCRSSIRFDTPPKGLHTFDSAELIARTYWADHPLVTSEKNVILIGSGRLLHRLLEQAVLVNCFGPLLRCCYHVFDVSGGESSGFLKDHPRISDVVTVVQDSTFGNEVLAQMLPDERLTYSEQDSTFGNEALAQTGADTVAQDLLPSAPDSSDNDILFFHTKPWNAEHGYIAEADRIVICTPSGIDNIKIAEKIRLLMATDADIHICGTDSIDGSTGFGGLTDIFTPELILKEKLYARARALNDYYNSLVSDPAKKKRWEELGTFTRRSNVAAADHMSTKLRILAGKLADGGPAPTDTDNFETAMKNFQDGTIPRDLCRRIEHERWMRFHSLYGWTYGSVRDNARRRHPLMVPFEDLTPKEQALDDISWELIETLMIY